MATAVAHNDSGGDSPVVVYVTTPNSSVTRDISHNLVTNRLAACVSSLPSVTSVYTWEGKVETSTEELLLCKTTAARLPALTAAVLKLHPYTTPEVIACPVVGGSQAYLQWVAECVRTDAGAQPPER